ncbi:MAG: division/cell wall cluster transcriptional repressor MraZ [Sphaerochaetaceae bacterium]
MLTGEFKITIDDKGRVLIPSRLRVAIDGDSMYATRGLDNCLWLMLPKDFEDLSRTILDGPGASFNTNRRLLQRNIISPAQLCDIDKAGRINVPPTLRNFAHLELKAECTLLGSGLYLELWNTTSYDTYLCDTEKNFNAAAENLSEMWRGRS